MRPSRLALLGAVLCGWVAGCGTPSGERAADPRSGERVLEVHARLPGRTEPSTLPDVAHAAAADLAGGIDGRPVVAADRLDATLPSITVAFTGDTLMHSPLVRRALAYGGGTSHEFAPMFAAVAPVLGAADLAVCHLETPVAPPGEALSTYPLYGVPADVVRGLAGAGYDRCSTASNHSLDRGLAGIDATVATLEQYGLGQTGMARTPEEAVAAVFDVGGIALAHLSYTYGFNGLRFPREEPWRTNALDPQRIIADARDARARGAQIVIVSLHWGDEGRSRVSDDQRAIADELTASGAVDLIVGHHAHVIQPIEMVNGRWVMFGLGNFVSNMPVAPNWPASTQDGVIVQVTITRMADGTIDIGTPVAVPTWVDKLDGYVIRPVIAGLADPTISDAQRERLFASLLRTREVIGAFIPDL